MKLHIPPEIKLVEVIALLVTPLLGVFLWTILIEPDGWFIAIPSLYLAAVIGFTALKFLHVYRQKIPAIWLLIVIYLCAVLACAVVSLLMLNGNMNELKIDNQWLIRAGAITVSGYSWLIQGAALGGLCGMPLGIALMFVYRRGNHLSDA